MNRSARVLLSLCLGSLAVLPGCIPGQVIDSAQEQSAAAPGSYWAVESAGGLDLFQMPAFRGDAGEWHSVAGVPEWFAEEGLYSHAADGSWALEISGGETDLDGLLQVWDPR